MESTTSCFFVDSTDKAVKSGPSLAEFPAYVLRSKIPNTQYFPTTEYSFTFIETY